MIDHRFAVLGAIVPLLGSAAYALDTLRGHTRPNRISWALWAFAPLIAFAAELSDHVGLDGLMTFAVGLGPLLVTIASFLNARAFWRLTRTDVACAMLSLLALTMWAVTGRGVLAIAFSILSDLTAGLPTVHKCWRHPETESAKAYLGGLTGASITLLALPTWTFSHYAFALYILLFDGLLAGLLFAPWRARRGAGAAVEGTRPVS